MKDYILGLITGVVVCFVVFIYISKPDPKELIRSVKVEKGWDSLYTYADGHLKVKFKISDSTKYYWFTLKQYDNAELIREVTATFAGKWFNHDSVEAWASKLYKCKKSDIMITNIVQLTRDEYEHF